PDAITGDRGLDFTGTQAKFLHEPPRRLDFRFRYASVGFRDMSHELEGRAEKNLRHRRMRSPAGSGLGGGSRVGAVGVPQARAFVEHMSNDGAHDRAPDIPGDHEADQGPKEFAFPSHSRRHTPAAPPQSPAFHPLMVA